MRHVLALDQGTTSSRAIIFDETGKTVASAQKEFPQHYPEPGWVEHDPDDLWRSQRDVAREALKLSGLKADDLVVCGITNQRETTILWDRQTGLPLHRAIVWQDRRTADTCARLKADGAESLVRQRTGLLLDIHRGDWDAELLRLFRIPRALLPEVRDSSGVFGTTEPDLFGAGIPVAGIAGDQQAALVGQACFEPGMAKSTYGTGCFLLLNTGTTAIESQNRLLTTPAYRIGGRTTYAMEGSIFVAGAAIKWLRDGLGLIREAAETDALARQVPDSHGVHLVPAFVGLGAPHWRPDARGLISGLTLDATGAHLARAALESVAFQTVDLTRAMAADGTARAAAIRVDGGMAANDWFCQFLADVLDARVERPAEVETTALGAAFLAGLATGVWADLTAVAATWASGAEFRPAMAPERRESLLAGWQVSLQRVLAT